MKTKCIDCGEVIRNLNGVYFYNGGELCGECYENYYFFCDHCDSICHNDNYGGDGLCNDCYDEEEGNNIRDLMGYHEGERKMTKRARKSRFRCGIEVEKEDGSVDIDVDEVFYDYGWCVEEDGSLDRKTGYEAVSPVLPLDFKYHKFLEKEINKIRYLINADHSESCGGHIHLSDTKRKPIEIARDIRGYIPLLYAMYPNRCDKHYSKAREFKDIFKCPALHASAFNISDKTCEVRIFPSPKNTDVLMWRLKLLHLMLLNPRKYVDEVVYDIAHKNALYLHLRLVYTDDQILEKVKKMSTYTEFLKANLYFK